MGKKNQTNRKEDNLIQKSITSFYVKLKGPAEFDDKPCLLKGMSKQTTRRKKLLKSIDDEANCDVSYKGNIKQNKRRKKIKSLPSDNESEDEILPKKRKKKPKPLLSESDSEEEVIFVDEYKLPEDDNAGSGNETDSFEHLSPEIILHTNEGDITFTSDTKNSCKIVNCSNESSSMNVTNCSKESSSINVTNCSKESSSMNVTNCSKESSSINVTEDNTEIVAFSSDSSLVSSTPLKQQISITKSEKQTTVLQKRSRILQLIRNTPSTEEYISTDFLPPPNTSLCDTTVIGNESEVTLDNNNITIINYVTKIEVDKTITFSKDLNLKADVTITSNIFEDAEYNESRRKYHLALINKIVETANKNFVKKLLFDSDKHMLKEYMMLPDNYKFLCCKLFTYTSKWHNLHKFVNKIKMPLNSSEVLSMSKYLSERNIISRDMSSEPSVYLLDLLELEDVKHIHKSLRLKLKKQTKPILMNSILEHCNQQTTLTSAKSLDKIVREKICEKLGLCIKLTDCFYNMFYKIHLLYSFANPEVAATPNDLYLFMMRVNNKEICMPSYQCEENTFFKDAEEFSRFSKACHLKNELLLEFERKKKSDNMKELCRVIYTEFKKLLDERKYTEEDSKKPTYLKRFTAGSKYASGLSFACKQMTTECPSEVNTWLELLLSQDVYYQQKSGFWYCQLAMVQHRYMKDQEKAAETLVTALKDKRMSQVDLSEITYKARGYCKTKKKSTTTQSIREELSSLMCSVPNSDGFPSIVIDSLSANSNRPSTAMRSQYKIINLNGDVEYVSVEQVALNHYIKEKGFLKGIHCEGSLMITIFSVLFWDILYSPTISSNIPFAFISELQYLPLDFPTPEFYINRRAEIEDRLENIKSNWRLEYLEDYVDTIWNNLSYAKSLIVRNVVADSVELSNIILCIGREIVSDVCKRLVEHFREYRAGMPDLFLWNAVTKKCKFVEVKGPGDKLSTKQKLWLQFLRSIGADIEVCHVHPVGSNRSQKYRNKLKQKESEL